MSANPPTVRHPRRWPLIVGALAAALLAAAVTTAFFALRGPGSQADDTPAPPATASAPPTTETAVRADGCLGGTDPAVAVLKAQRAAPLTDEGAAAFTAAAARWNSLQPVPSNRQQVLDDILTKDADPALRAQKTAAPGVKTWLTTDGGLYRVRRSGVQAEVDFQFRGFVSQGVEQQQVQLSGTAQLAVEDGQWHWRASEGLAADNLSVDGIAYRSGC